MKHLLFALALALFLAGCASNPPAFDTGMAKAKTGDNRGAYNDFVSCAESTQCANNAGSMAFNMGDRATAQRWWTLTAGRGDDFGRARLTQYGMPLPAANVQPATSTTVCTKVGNSTICN